MSQDHEFWGLRRCMREPIPEIFHAAYLLDRAVGAHLAGDRSLASALFRAADMPAVRAWTESLWGSKKNNPDQQNYHRRRTVPGAPAFIDEGLRDQKKEPSAEEKKYLIEKYGRNCAFCGIPLVRKEIREALVKKYPDVVTWGKTAASAHAALQCMWMQFDHVIPHSRGGDSSLDNFVVTCAGCNFGRGHYTLEEFGLIDPRTVPIVKTSWDGLERLLSTP